MAWQSWALVLGVWLALPKARAEEPALTPQQQQQLKEATALNKQGVDLYLQGQFQEATVRLRKALELRQKVYPKDHYPLGHPDLATSLNNLGIVHHALEEYGKAESLYRQALEMRQQLYPAKRYPQGHPHLATSCNSLGTLLLDRGESDKAELFYRQALEMRQKLYPRERYPLGHADLATSLNHLGDLLLHRGEYGQAETCLRQALEMRQQLYPRERYPLGHPHLTTSLNNLGSLLQAQGEFGKAETLFRQALELRQRQYPRDRYPQGHPDLAISLNNLGSLLMAEEEFAKAEPFLRQALEMRQRQYPRDRYPQGHPDLAISLNNLGSLLANRGENAAAELVFRQALEMRRTLYPRESYPQGHQDLAIGCNNLGYILMERGEYGKAEPLVLQALEMRQTLYPRRRYPQGHPELAASLNNLGYLLLAQGEFGKAESVFRQSLEMHGQLGTRLAEVAPEAVALNAAATFPRTRDALLSATRQLPGSDARTYDAIWHSRSALTRVYQQRHLALTAAATDAAVRQEWDRLQALRRQREHLIMTSAPTPSQRKLHEEKLATLSQDIDRLDKELLTQLPSLKHHRERDRLGPDALRRLLPAQVVLIDFLRYTHVEQDSRQAGAKGEKLTRRYLAFVVSRAEVLRVELGAAAEIDEALRNWRESLTTRVPLGNEAAQKQHETKLARQGALLRRLVWDPLQKQLPRGTTTLYLAPDAFLTQLPWSALPGQQSDRVLLDDYALAVLPHSPFLLEQLLPPPPRSAKRPPAPEGLLLVGGVKYDERPLPTVVARAGEEIVAHKVVWHYLNGTALERELLSTALARTGPKVTVSLGGAEAGTLRLRQELEKARYAHLSTHGFFADKEFRSLLELDPKHFKRSDLESGGIRNRVGEAARNPLVLSGLVCSGANRADTPERGILSGDAIAGLLLDDLHLAVLSACDTGLGDVAGGEGVFGLQRAFHLAGCKNVVASLWKVDDAATAALMVRFYGYLFAEGKDKQLPAIEALRRAQLDLYRHPELIPSWSKGELRAPGKPRPATTPAPADTPKQLLTSDGRAPIRLWAAFTLSGLGREATPPQKQRDGK